MYQSTGIKLKVQIVKVLIMQNGRFQNKVYYINQYVSITNVAASNEWICPLGIVGSFGEFYLIFDTTF